MAVELSINPNTIQRAYAELEAEGFICTLPGRGSFAARQPEGDPARRQELTSRLRELIAELKYLHMTDGEILSLLREEGAHND